MKRWIAPILLLLLLGPAAAEDDPKQPPKPLTPEQAADAVLVAMKAKDDAALKALAEMDDPDPWLVADELCYRGEHDAAEAFAKAAPRVGVEKLPAYVGAWRKRELDKAERDLLAVMNAAMQARTPQKVVEGTASLPASLDTVVRIRLVHARGIALSMTRRLRASQALLHRAADAACALGWLRRGSDLYHEAGSAACRSSAFAVAVASWERRLALCKRSGDRRVAAATLGNIGIVYYRLGDYAKALSTYERALAALDALGDQVGAARTLGNIGSVYRALGDYAKALSFHERALAQKEALGDKTGAATTLGNIGNVHDALGEYTKALSIQERALAAMEGLGDRAGVARTLGNIGSVHFALGDYAKALSFHERALAQKEALGDKTGAATTLGNIGAVHFALGDYAKALSTRERALAALDALGDRVGAARTLGNIGNVHGSLGDYAKALSTYKRALAAMEALGDKVRAARTLGNIGNVYLFLGDYAKALSIYEQALASHEALGDRAGAAGTLGNIGNAYYSLGDYAKALSTHERVLALKEALGDKAGAAATLGNIGTVHDALGDYAKALSVQERALAAMEALGDRAGAALTRGNIGCVHCALGDFAKALSFARRAVVQLGTVVSGLGAEAGAGAREPLSIIYEVGARAALEQGDPAELTFFLESGRAGALLEDLNAREVLGAAALSPELRAAETKARAAEAAALKALRTEADAGDIRKMRARRLDLKVTQEKVSEVIARIQREAKAGASVVYPEAATLDEIRATLSDGDVLVLYGMLEKEACALVVTKADARIVSLGESAPIRAAVEALGLDDRETDDTDALAALSKLVVEPLGLPETMKRLLVSPAGVLGYVPFAALMSQATVTYVPSGTTYRLLREEQALQGTGVLALGDPDYETRMDEQAVAVVRGGLRLVRLPATREEAKAVGTQVLLGPEATEARLAAAVGKQRRWRAVHLACHGLVNTERPALSSLAVTPAGTTTASSLASTYSA